MSAKPIISAQAAADRVDSGNMVMVGGFLGVGSPDQVLRALKARGTSGLTLVCNDTGIHDAKSGRCTGVAPLIESKAFSKVMVSHIGTNPETQRQMNAGETEVELIPQGTLAERVRAAGAGLGGVLTPTGVGTEVARGKQVIQVAGRDFLLETALGADIALIKARTADRAGNLVFCGTARNFNPLMATAAQTVIAEVEELVEIGDLDPDAIHTPSIYVDFLVLADQGRG